MRVCTRSASVIGILHISDIHFGSGPNPAAGRVQQIKAAIQSEIHDIDELLLIMSGDVANWGKQSEYSVAVDFISQLEKALGTIKGLKFLGTVAIPGNHDLDFDEEGAVRPVLLSTIGDLVGNVSASSDVVEQILKVQRPFFDFEELVATKPHRTVDQLFWSREFVSSAGKILVRCFNTAWVSRKKEVPGQIFFPTQVVPDISETDAALVLSVFHHPYGWFQPENGRSFRRLIETSSDIVFTGHEHDAEAYSRTSGAAATTNYVEGAALQASGIQTGFNLAKVDLSTQTYNVRQFDWSKDMYTPATLGVAVFTRNQALLEHQFVNNTRFSAYLDDIGTPFSHPIKTQLSLSDLFIYPNLKVMTVAQKAETAVMSADVLEFAASKSLLSVAGPPTSGKTSLAKALYKDLQQRKKLVPVVLLQPDEIRGATASHVHSAVERAFEQQYSKRLLDRFNQLDPQSKVIILDDWHKARFSTKGKTQVLDALQKMFGRIIVLTDDASMLNQITDALAAGELPAFAYCEIKPFGYRLRGELVTKWEALGREFEVEEMELTHRISEGEYLLDTLVGKGIVPAFPFFIFSVLQEHDPAGHTGTFGSYGHIYQALLTTRMARVSPKGLNLKFAYLSLLAFYVFESGRDVITLGEAKSLHSQYEKEYLNANSVPFEQLLAELEAGQVLSVVGDEVRFKYRYGYYYFVAEYFHNAISDVTNAETVRATLRRMADSAYNDDNAHILIFYLYMSKDRALMEHILGNAQKLFAAEGPSDLDKDVAFVNALYGTTLRLEAPPEDTDANREEYRKQRDAAAESEPDVESDDEPDAGTRSLDFAIQSMNIMGQVLRNFPADLKADLKLSLANESYKLGLRTLRAVLRFLETNVDGFRRDMLKYFKLLHPASRRNDEQLQAAADRAVRSFAELVLFGSIKRISLSVGAEELRETYEAVRAQAGEGHIPTRMIDLAIKLDHFARIPERDVEDLKKRLEGNPAAYTTLRMLVSEFLYLFPVEHRTRQRMIELLDFPPGAATMSGAKKVRQITATAE
jgi:hypothetical protein